MTFSATPDGLVRIPHLEAPVDTTTASLYAVWLQNAARAEVIPALREGLRTSSSELRGVIRQAMAAKTPDHFLYVNPTGA